MKNDINLETKSSKRERKITFNFDTKELMNIVRQRMIEKNLNQKMLAEKIGVSEVTFSRYIRGEREPRIDVIVKILQVLNLSLDDISYKDKNEWYLKSRVLDIFSGLNEDEQLELLDVMEYWSNMKKKKKLQYKKLNDRELRLY